MAYIEAYSGRRGIRQGAADEDGDTKRRRCVGLFNAMSEENAGGESGALGEADDAIVRAVLLYHCVDVLMGALDVRGFVARVVAQVGRRGE